jgi:hypothetical protein
MSKTKTYKELLDSELRNSDQLYCCYCLARKHSYSCCGENHFVTYSELYDEDKDVLAQELLDEYEQWSDTQ